ncbi:MAG: hypothetical protein HZB33_10335 [Nitrospirae bacterium]|nr:hypothetical protein [Nitrospirota bacterium]
MNTPPGKGGYHISVYVVNSGSKSGVDAVGSLSFDITDQPMVSSVTLTADKTSPLSKAKARKVTFTAKASGGGGRYAYQFYVKGPSAGDEWKMVRDYGPSNTLQWKPPKAGAYFISVYARNVGSSANVEAAGSIPFEITDLPSEMEVSVSADRKSPASRASAGTITFVAQAVGGSGKYEYQFHLNGPSTGNAWKGVRDYNTSNTFRWKPREAGRYVVLVYARNSGSRSEMEAAWSVPFLVGE